MGCRGKVVPTATCLAAEQWSRLGLIPGGREMKCVIQLDQPAMVISERKPYQVIPAT